MTVVYSCSNQVLNVAVQNFQCYPKQMRTAILMQTSIYYYTSIQLNVVLLSIMLPFAECILYLSTTGKTNRCFHRIYVILTVITWILGLTGLAWWIALGIFGSNPPSGGTITI